VCKLPLINSFSQCQLNVTRYYYDFKSSTCKKFIYSGCFGNANNFETVEECENRCQIPLLFGKIMNNLKNIKNYMLIFFKFK
jgi:hypothetical protein